MSRSSLLLAMPGNETLAGRLAAHLDITLGACTLRRFPDGESYVRIDSAVHDQTVVVVCTLDRPDDKLVPLYLLCSALRAQQAARIVLVAPYLPYMRQDRAFRPGEAVSAQAIARWLSGFVDALVCVDPHLHRIAALGEVYTIRTRAVAAAPAISRWIAAHVAQPLIIGPDAESRQWAEAIAAPLRAPVAVLEKQRDGDTEVRIELGDLQVDRRTTPVLVDDIVSSGATLAVAARQLHAAGFAAPYAVVVHPLFAAGALQRLDEAGIARVVSCDTVAHASNAIDLSTDLAAAVRQLLDATGNQAGNG